jgi:hypothetical protein
MPQAPWRFIERLFIINRDGRSYRAGPEPEAGWHFRERPLAADGWQM